MAVKFAIFEKSNPMNPEADVSQYTGVKSMGNITFKSSGREIFECCTVMHADMLSVSDASLYDRLFPPWLSPTSTDTPAIRAGAGKSPVTKL